MRFGAALLSVIIVCVNRYGYSIVVMNCNFPGLSTSFCVLYCSANWLGEFGDVASTAVSSGYEWMRDSIGELAREIPLCRYVNSAIIIDAVRSR